MKLTAASPTQAPTELLALPWNLPLTAWPDDILVDLPRGISRHEVRFVCSSHSASGDVLAVKEIGEHSALREYSLLRDLDRLGVPSVDPVAVVTGRSDRDGNPLEPALVTRHLARSLPYRAMFEQTMRPDTIERLLDALAVLLVRLHLVGFAWNDCSLSNTLFRRDAGAFAAYLVDAETGDLRPSLSDGQRQYDIETAQMNIAGEFYDLAEGGLLHPSLDPIVLAEVVLSRYLDLWHELTAPTVYRSDQRHRIDARVRRLNELGFDVGELQIDNHPDGGKVTIIPKVVDAGHHQRQLLRLTGLDVQENQARRLLNDLEAFTAVQPDHDPDDPVMSASPEVIAHRWLREVFRPAIRMVPRRLRPSIDPAQVFHEMLDHRWFLSEESEHDVGMETAARDYVDKVLLPSLDPALLDPARIDENALQSKRPDD
ncbi:lipopolysaccharide kinase [Mangrovactinospora gilvigrisea]|uniref:Lipopolysaccharide kinase n=1 Tax=Mangrovactinospora gilvigrisea TaxID=1428644 RepID=A0A1J7C8B1_9ACTN|nr:DUF4032 domain-containing protein [Mangrovactinospora gilvigrisea]OIV37764.1 lipopolysaccharide kinase [Mangrovactinospora gilvigrisea]